MNIMENEHQKRKVLKGCICGSLIILAVVLVFFSYRYVQGKRAEKQTKLEKLYENQNYAFAMGIDPYYKGYSEVWVDGLIIRLGAYDDYTGSGHDISLESIEKYLADEHDENGQLAILYPPQEIKEYLDWFSNVGYIFIEDYESGLRHYLSDHKEYYGTDLISLLHEDELKKLIVDYNSSPKKEE